MFKGASSDDKDEVVDLLLLPFTPSPGISESDDKEFFFFFSSSCESRDEIVEVVFFEIVPPGVHVLRDILLGW